MSKFSKRDKIKNEANVWECIVADEQTAVFGKITKCLPYEKEKVVSYEEIFAISQTVQDGFEYKECVGVCELTGAFVFENDNYDYDADQNTYFLKE